MTTAIVVAAGKSTRMGGGVDKAFLSLIDKPVIAWSLLAFEHSSEIDRIIVVVRKDQVAAAKAVARMFGISKLQSIVAGGNKRQESVSAGLAACEVDTKYVVIHDGARPCVTTTLIADILKLVKRYPAVTAGHLVTDTVKRCLKSAMVSETVDRSQLWAVQTPQAFQFSALVAAYKKLKPSIEVTDDCQAIELAGGSVKIFEYLKPNFKITTPDDVAIASAVLRNG